MKNNVSMPVMLLILELFLFSAGPRTAEASFTDKYEEHQIEPIPTEYKISASCPLRIPIRALDAISYQMEPIAGLNHPEGATLTPGEDKNTGALRGLFQWVPDPAQVGSAFGSTYWTSFTATCNYVDLYHAGGAIKVTKTSRPVKISIQVVPLKTPTFDFIHDQAVSFGKTLQFNVSATRGDGQKAEAIKISEVPGKPFPISYSFGVFQPSKGYQFSLTPLREDAGKEFYVRFTTSEGGPPDKPATMDVKITVNGIKPPAITPIADQTVSPGSSKTLSIVAHNDPDGTLVENYDAEYVGPQFHSFAEINPKTGTLTFFANEADAGKTITLRVSACSLPLPQGTQPNPRPIGFSAAQRALQPASPEQSLTQTMDVKFIIPAYETPVIDPIGNRKVAAGKELRFTVVAKMGGVPVAGGYHLQNMPGKSFPQGPEGTLTRNLRKEGKDALLPENPTKATIDPNTGEFKWQSLLEQAGKQFGVRVFVGGASQDFLIDVVTDSGPVFLRALLNAHSVPAGKTLSFDVGAEDPDGGAPGLIMKCDDHRFWERGKPNAALVNKPSAHPENTTEKTFTWSPDQSQVGTYTVNFIATDNEGAQQTSTHTIKVLPNTPPVISPISNKTVAVGQTLTFDVIASDADNADGSPPAVTMLSANPKSAPKDKFPDGAQFLESKTFSWTPRRDQVGHYAVTFSATDGQEHVTLTVPINVTLTASKPESSPAKIRPIPDQTVTAGEHLVFHVTATPAEDSAPLEIRMLSISELRAERRLVNYPVGCEFLEGKTFSWWPSDAQTGRYSAIFVSTLRGKETSRETASILVKAAVPPVSELPPGVAGPPIKNLPPADPPPIKELPEQPILPPAPPQSQPVPSPVIDPAPQPIVTPRPEPKPVAEPAPQLSPAPQPEPEPAQDPAPQPAPTPQPTPEPTPSPENCTCEGQTKSTAEVAKSMEGVWDSRTWGTVYAKATGSRLEGTYTNHLGRFVAHINANCEIEGRWREFQIIPDGDQTGTFKIKTVKDVFGDYLGEETNDDSPGNVGGGWTWRKLGPNDVTEPDWYPKSINPGRSLERGHQHAVCPSGDTCSGEEMARIAQAFAGRWNTNNGDIEASASGITVEGSLFGTGEIKGTVQPDGSLKGRWKASPDSHGEFIFWIDPVGELFWGNATDDLDPGVWNEGWQGDKKK